MPGKAKIVISFCICILILVLVGIYTYFNIGNYKKSTSWVLHTQNVILEAEKVHASMLDMEIAQREYVLLHSSNSLTRYNKSLVQRDRAFNALLQLTKDNPQQQMILDSIHSLYLKRTKTGQIAIALRDEKGFETAKSFIAQGKGQEMMNTFQKKINEFSGNERRLLQKRIMEAERNFRSVILIITCSVLISIAIILATMFLFIKDYERRLASRKRLRESELRLKNILNALPVGVFMINADGTPTYANTKAKELLGKDIVSRSTIAEMPEIFHAYKAGTTNIYPVPELPISKALQGKPQLGIEDMEIRRDNLIIPLRINAIPLFNSEGELECAISVFEDITLFKEAEHELINAKRLAEESLKIKEAFLANMSHEIRTPLNAIIGFTEILYNSKMDKEEKELIKIIQTSGNNLLRIINDILDISKIESGMIRFEEHPLSIRDIFQSLRSMFTAQIKDKKVSVFFSEDENVPEVLNGDPVRLTQILINLIGNAVKFTQEGYITVSSRLEQDHNNTCTLSFFIKDTGIGIAEDKLQHIFERFNQADRSVTRNYGGTGLGLSIAKQLIELQGGTIRVSSQLGKGSEFYFTLPFTKGSFQVPEKNKPGNIPVDFNALQKKKILAVEDNLINVKLLEHIFSGKNIPIDIANDGKQALKALEQKPYDIILMDMELPELNGYETTQYIRQQLKMDIPIIAMTAHAMAGEREKCLSIGMNDYLSKPLNTTLLFEKMYSILFREDIQLKPHSDTLREAPATAGDEIDLNYLREFSGGNEAFEGEIISMFLEQMPKMYNELKQAYNNKNQELVKGYAHKMKSSVGVIGISSLIAILENIESGISDPVLQTEELIAGLGKKLDSVYTQLKTILNQKYDHNRTNYGSNQNNSSD